MKPLPILSNDSGALYLAVDTCFLNGMVNFIAFDLNGTFHIVPMHSVHVTKEQFKHTAMEILA